MLIVGLIGGVASGKSEVARQLQALGAAWLDADRAGHDALRDADIMRAARQRWGEQIFTADGQIDRSQLARRVFGPSPQHAEDLKHLESLTHPKIREQLTRQIEQLQSAGTQIAVLDAPVLLKAGWSKFCDRLIFVDAPRQQRLQRAMSRGWSKEDFDAREAAQESLQVKRAAADAVIDNSGSLNATHSQVVRLWQSLVG